MSVFHFHLFCVWYISSFHLVRDSPGSSISGDLNVATALVDAFQHGDYWTRQIPEHWLKLVDKIPKFSGIFQKMG
ncbi:U-box domain-containing protein 44-like protein [Cinnamomum micranthum f. kanehirae]|uniref:U-box domain-containing protein 44-like protein n=1 Tax=Cinnamomum micranthum f. kanehirae TaxID=337451 RepID=A0A3S3PCC6_9MAGN|nr:U-box domain-containing protein 44-like protein [Cinnamomum micranthum f. kanehirae]